MHGIFPPGVLNAWENLTARLRGAGEVIPGFVIRLVLGFEFWESGIEKLHGENWFAQIQSDFPFPFSAIPADLSWGLATWLEIIGAVLLWAGLFTRVVAFKLLVLTFVATAAVHWPDMWTMASDLLQGYAITDKGHGNFKLPLLFAVLLLPLIFNGPGKLSLDHLFARVLHMDTQPTPLGDAYAWAIAAVILGVAFLMLVPTLGFALVGIAILLVLFGRYARA
jgi:putative oxidoreductase